jgi:hypothetical protein
MTKIVDGSMVFDFCGLGLGLGLVVMVSVYGLPFCGLTLGLTLGLWSLALVFCFFIGCSGVR